MEKNIFFLKLSIKITFQIKLFVSLLLLFKKLYKSTCMYKKIEFFKNCT